MASTLLDVNVIAELLARGAGAIIDANDFQGDHLKEFASRANKGYLVLRNVISVDMDDLHEIASRSGGHVILDFTR
jgi:hypothetical protein